MGVGEWREFEQHHIKKLKKNCAKGYSNLVNSYKTML